MHKKSLLTLLFILFLDMVGVGILIPVIPLFFTEPSSPYFVVGHPYLVKYAYVFLGLLIAAYPIAQFFAAPILGQLSDKYGRRKILIISQVGTAVGYVLFAFGVLLQSLPLLFFSRLLDGATGGNIAVAQAAIADITPPKDRAKTFGLMGAVFGFGFIVGPFLGGILASPKVVSWFNPAMPFWFAAVLVGLCALVTTFVLKETHPQKRAELHVDFAKSVHNIIRAFKIANLRDLFITSLFFQSGFAFFTTFFSVYLIEKFGFDQTQLGNTFGYVGIWIIFTQAIVTRTLARRFNEVAILRITFFGCALGVMLFFVPQVSCGLYAVIPIFAIFNGLTQANLMGLVSRQAGPEIQGEVMGINASLQALSASIPPLLSGLLAASINPSATLIAASAIIVLAGVIFIVVAPRLKARASQGSAGHQ